MTFTSRISRFRDRFTRRGRRESQADRQARQRQKAGQAQRIAKERAIADGKAADWGMGG